MSKNQESRPLPETHKTLSANESAKKPDREIPTYTLDQLLGAGEDLWSSDEELDAFLAEIRKAHGKAG
jgi:hypothetical protein